jgi:arginine decarboxylase
MDLLQSFPILLLDDELGDETAAGRATRALVDHLRADGTQVITAADLQDAEQILASTATLSGLLIDWDVHHNHDQPNGNGNNADSSRIDVAANVTGATASQTGHRKALIEAARRHNPSLPIFVLADHSSMEQLPPEVVRQINGYVWKLEDTPAFVAGHIEEARREYLAPLLPPFFDALVRFTQEARYSWHTPGHSGGTAFLKTPVGAAFHEFFGENTLRSDLSVSVGELGSLLEHTGPIGEAEAQAARIFGAERTMFVTNGTSTANKIVFHSCVRHGDVVLVDRNCHKSIMHAIVMTGAIPVYLRPTRNAQGMIGPIPPAELNAETVRHSMAASPLVPDGTTKARLAVLTNSTYDGLCYDADGVLAALGDSTDRVLFDEAWFAYAHFHPLYGSRHATGIKGREGAPATFATQSTHKLLTAFSQASMIHLHDPQAVIAPAALEEAFMMHTSTSPQYGIIASLDVAARTMEGQQGTELVDDAIAEALAFRHELSTAAGESAEDDWCFDVWQPPLALSGSEEQQRDPDHWTLKDGEAWHGYGHVSDGHAMLDPIKVTVLTPGIDAAGELGEHGIPAALVSRFLDERGIVVEKTGSYSFLVLFSLGITRGKAGTLLSELFEFKRLYDRDARLSEALPRLVAEHRDCYGEMTLRTLAGQLHGVMRESAMNELIDEMYDALPEPVVTPSAAYEQLVAGNTEMVAVVDLPGRVSTAMLVPYPPGIPVIMPGERFPTTEAALVRYLTAGENLSARFPGFETEIHGIEIQQDGSYRVPCLRA